MGRPAPDQLLIDRLRAARGDGSLAVLEGFHALKHALRFGAEVELVVASEAADLDGLAARLAPDVADRVRGLATEVPDDAYRALGGHAHHTRVAAVARRPAFAPAAALDARRDAPAVLLDSPRHLGNLGAVVRVAAGADAAAVLTLGGDDPWHPVAIRGAAGLHFAVPVGAVGEPRPSSSPSGTVEPAESAPAAPAEGEPAPLDLRGRPLVALDPDGDPLDASALPADAVLAFGSERDGLSAGLLAAADARLRIPMRPGVSSLNLATSVAAVLFARRLA